MPAHLVPTKEYIHAEVRIPMPDGNLTMLLNDSRPRPNWGIIFFYPMKTYDFQGKVHITNANFMQRIDATRKSCEDVKAMVRRETQRGHHYGGIFAESARRAIAEEERELRTKHLLDPEETFAFVPPIGDSLTDLPPNDPHLPGNYDDPEGLLGSH